MAFLEFKKNKKSFEEEEEEKEIEKPKEEEIFNPTPGKLLVGFIFLLAIVPRLIYLFYFTNPNVVGIDWYGDVYHHWQIAWLSKEVGFKEGFLRLWDFKGLEYYWGLLHPLILIFGFIISGTDSILIPRIVSVVFSSLAITLVFVLVSRYFNKTTAFAAAVFLSFMPVILFSDTLGMQEPLGMFLLLLGIYLWPKIPVMSGVSWMLAGMVRSEYWIFGFALLLVVLLRERNVHAKIGASSGYLILLLFYLKYMLDHTGNPVYPIYWNFLATVIGDWFIKEGVELSAKVRLIKTVSQGLAIFFSIWGLFFLLKRPKSYLLILLGLASLVFIFFEFGFGSYLYGYPDDSYTAIIDRNWVDRLMAWPYGFLGIFLAIILLYFIPKILPKFLEKSLILLGGLAFLTIIGLTQLIWPSIDYHYKKALGPLENSSNFASRIAKNYQGEGSILIPADRPFLTYYLGYYQKIPASSLVSEFYDPFYYAKGDPFSDWETFRLDIIEWLRQHNAEIFVLAGGIDQSTNYGKMLVREEGKLFKMVEAGEGFRIYRIEKSLLNSI